MTNSTGNIASGVGVNSGSSDIKVATPDLIIFDNSSISTDSMADLIFEDIGGQELLEISRSDLINSANINFPKIKIKDLRKNIESAAGAAYSLPIQSIRLFDHVPQYVAPVQINASTNSLEISVINILPGYQVEVEIVSKANRFDDTIYTSEQGAGS